MKILEYNDLDTSGVGKQYQKIIRCLERDDFHSAEVRKLAEHDCYRAKLDDANRLLFKILRYQGESYALILEVIRQHAYEKSRFLRGAAIDEAKIPPLAPGQASDAGLPELGYVNPDHRRFHFLDKIISFDPAQQEIYDLPLPLIVIGPAGSGKTALTLEKMKRAGGRILYVTLSPYLVENSRNLYYAHHYENEDQELVFLSFREYLETLRVPEGREIAYNVFAGWMARFPKQQRAGDAHKLYEEFRGVITGSAGDRPYLNRDEYLELGVRQSIFLAEEREKAYALFEKYLAFLKDNRLYDPNILAHEYLSLVQPAYDLVVVDEVQDITNIQLKLILRGLRKPEQFLLCGDSNQIVHPNFFSWSNLKSMFYRSEDLETARITRVLHANYRNAEVVTDLANRLLRIKQHRFGSIDRESHYLIASLADRSGTVTFMPDSEAAKKELNQKTRRSTKFAVLVMRDEQKAEARRFFDTPLLFSVQEAKGLEYENVILWNFISGERANFQAIVQGVVAADLEDELAAYARARDKTDKSAEVYKFFINALYVAITRAVRNLYLIESDTRHPLLDLLGLREAREKVDVAVQQSSLEEWQAEARKLELQGKQEQADDIRRGILKTQAVPWDVWSGERVPDLMERAFDPKQISRKPKQALFDYALYYDDPPLIDQLDQHRFEPARLLIEYRYRSGGIGLNKAVYARQRSGLLKRHLSPYEGRHFKDILRQCDSYGVDYRNPFNHTPLMLAARAGNGALLAALVERGANADCIDNYGLTAWQLALLRAFEDAEFATRLFPAVHERLEPSSVSLKAADRLIKLDNRVGEFMVFETFFVLLRAKINDTMGWWRTGFKAADFSERFERLPDGVIPPHRKKRTYFNALLARNEIDSNNPYNRHLVKRIGTGYYLLNPRLELRRGEDWINVYHLANLPLMEQTSGGHNKLLYILQQLMAGETRMPAP
jgi:hypothetical protein